MGNLPQSKVAEVVPNTLNVDRNTCKIELHNSLTLPETRVSLWVSKTFNFYSLKSRSNNSEFLKNFSIELYSPKYSLIRFRK